MTLNHEHAVAEHIHRLAVLGFDGAVHIRAAEHEIDMHERHVETLTDERLGAAIRAVEDDRLSEVLELYYIDGFTWDQVAERMGLDKRWVFRLHGRALMMINVPKEMERG